MSTIYIVSEFDKNQAVVYTGKRHWMSIRAACARFAPDAIAIETESGGAHYEARDILKRVSGGVMHMSNTMREQIKKALAAAEYQSKQETN